jgi:FkbM family methyltransferase
MEPDPGYLEVGRRNAELNGLGERVSFVQAAIGDEPGAELAFQCESDGQVRRIAQHDLASLMALSGLDRVDLVLADVQGAETLLLARAKGELRAGRVRFLIVSTHHHSISGDPRTHQDALALLIEAGAHVIAEHSVGESFSGDGLIAVSFDERDREFTVPISRARYRDSLFGEVESDLAEAARAAEVAREEADRLRAELARLAVERDGLAAEIEAIMATKMWRWAKAPREVYARLRRR